MKASRIVLAIVGFAILATVAFICFYAFYFWPRSAPMRDHDLAHSYARILSQVQTEDLSALSISLPTTRIELSQVEIRRILQRLHDTGHFPEWNPDFNLKDWEGMPLIFSIRPKDSNEGKTVVFGPDRLQSGDYMFSVRASTMREAVEAP